MKCEVPSFFWGYLFILCETVFEVSDFLAVLSWLLSPRHDAATTLFPHSAHVFRVMIVFLHTQRSASITKSSILASSNLTSLCSCCFTKRVSGKSSYYSSIKTSRWIMQLRDVLPVSTWDTDLCIPSRGPFVDPLDPTFWMLLWH